jgi:hypothetical protein
MCKVGSTGLRTLAILRLSVNGDFPVYDRVFASGHFLYSVSLALDCPSRIASNGSDAPQSFHCTRQRAPHNVVNPKVAGKSQCAVFKDENGWTSSRETRCVKLISYPGSDLACRREGHDVNVHQLQ